MADERLIRNVSDTARWVALYRARESERPDAHFHDRFARQLAGERGAQIAAAEKFAGKNEWSFTARTWAVDQEIQRALQQGCDLVLNLAAGLDARPYRMALPASLRWIEVDLPGILEYKEEILAGAKPVCRLERVRLDLSDATARGPRLRELAGDARRGLVITEGLLIYLTEDQAAGLARDLHAASGLETWLTDLASPGLLHLMQKRMGQSVRDAGAPFQFAPASGPQWFAHYGWQSEEVYAMLHTAAKLKRLPNLLFKMFALFPPTHPGASLRRPWSGVIRLRRV